MPFYTDNRFDQHNRTSYSYCAPIGPHGRTSYFSVHTKGLPGFPGWHLLQMHADYAYSVECSTRDILSTIAELQAEWVADVTARWTRKGSHDAQDRD